jgi:glycosyltransferase involved in cell wall biosynthesis
MKPKVSVVIPAYNAASDLAATIESVLQQTFVDFELLIVNDGSTDDTEKLVRQYTARDERIKLISQHNQGVATARNRGIQESSGDYIAFLDSDDLWMPNKLATHVQHLNSSPALGLSFARVEFMKDDGSLTGQCSNLRLRNIRSEHLYRENLICTPSNAVIRRSVLEQVGGFNKCLSGYADIELFLRISCYGWKIEGLNQVLVYYRISTSGMSAQLQSMEEEWYLFSDQVRGYAPELVGQHYSQAKAILLRYLARRALRLNLNSEVALGFINRALHSDWKITLMEPRRTLLTISAIYGQYFLRLARLKTYCLFGSN